LALVASGLKIAYIEKVRKTYTRYDMPVFVAGIRQSALKGAAGIKIH
jgi:hypothetical protein